MAREKEARTDQKNLIRSRGRGSIGLYPFNRSILDDDFWSLGALDSPALWSPEIEMVERDNKLIVRADLPGLEKDNVTVEVDEGVLTISGERKDEHEEKGEGFYRSERSYGRFYRAIPLPTGVNADQSEATFKNGVLEIAFRAPKQEQRNAKRIQVR